MKRVTFIIPSKADSHPQQAIENILKLSYPQNQIEILLSKGNNPSRQRNEAALQASGELLYFLDDDSYIDKSALINVLKYFSHPEVVAVGGPALTHDKASTLERSFGAAVESWFGTAGTRARSRIIGEAREVRGEELILCNLLIRKDVFLSSGGFNVALYPNEENELLKRLRKKALKFYYDPSMIVRRPRRKLISDFIRQMKSYGNGRAQHLFRSFTIYDLVFLAPSAFVIYLTSLPLLPLKAGILPLCLYILLCFLAAARSAKRHSSLSVFLNLLFIFPLMHIAYGVGLFIGLIRRNKKISIYDKIQVDPVKATLGAS